MKGGGSDEGGGAVSKWREGNGVMEGGGQGNGVVG